MSAKRMIDYVMASGLVNPASNYRYFMTPSAGKEAEADEYRNRMIQPISKENRRFIALLEKHNVPVIDYSNLFQPGIDESSKMDDWWVDWLKRDNQDSCCPFGEDEKAKEERQLRAVNQKLGATRPPCGWLHMEYGRGGMYRFEDSVAPHRDIRVDARRDHSEISALVR